MRLGEPALVGHPYHGDLPYRSVLEEAVLYLLGGEPLTGDLEHVVAATRVGEAAVRIPAHHVPRDVPLAAKGLLRLLHLLPVADRARASPYPQPPDLPVRNLPALVVAHPDLEARHGRAQRSRPDVPRAVGDEDVPHLRRPQPVEQLHAERLVPPPVKLLRQRLSGRRGETKAGEVPLPGVGVREHVVDHRRHVDQHGGSEALDAVEERIGRAPLRPERRRSADGEGEQQVGARGVPEVQLGDGERDVVLAHPEHALAITLRRVGEGPVRLENRFGPPRRAAGEEPDRRVVAVRGIVLLLRGFPLHPGDELGIVDHREGPKVLHHGLRVLEHLPARRVDEGEGRSRVIEEVLDLVTLEVRVQHHDDGADLEDAEEGACELGPVL